MIASNFQYLWSSIKVESEYEVDNRCFLGSDSISGYYELKIYNSNTHKYISSDTHCARVYYAKQTLTALETQARDEVKNSGQFSYSYHSDPSSFEFIPKGAALTSPVSGLKAAAVQMSEQLLKLHSLHVLHRSLTPESFCCGSARKIMLCDFSHIIYTPTGSVTSTTYKRRDQYASRSAMLGNYNKASDYFSLALILIELYGASVNYFTRNNHINTKDQAFNLLISLLTASGIVLNFHKVISDWSSLSSDRFLSKYQGKIAPIPSFSFCGSAYTSRDTLAHAMSKDPAKAVPYFANGGVELYLNKIDRQEDAARITIIKSSVKNTDLLLAEELYVLSGTGHLFWEDTRFTAADLPSHPKLSAILRSGYLEFVAADQGIDVNLMKELSTLNSLNADVARKYCNYLFANTRNISAVDFFLKKYGKVKLTDDNKDISGFLNDADLLAIICDTTGAANVINYIKSSKPNVPSSNIIYSYNIHTANKTSCDIINLYQNIEYCCVTDDEREAVREHFITNSVYADEIHFRRYIDQFKSASESSNNKCLKEKLKKYPVPKKSLSIKAIADNCLSCQAITLEMMSHTEHPDRVSAAYGFYWKNAYVPTVYGACSDTIDKTQIKNKITAEMDQIDRECDNYRAAVKETTRFSVLSLPLMFIAAAMSLLFIPALQTFYIYVSVLVFTLLNSLSVIKEVFSAKQYKAHITRTDDYKDQLSFLYNNIDIVSKKYYNKAEKASIEMPIEFASAQSSYLNNKPSLQPRAISKFLAYSCAVTTLLCFLIFGFTIGDGVLDTCSFLLESWFGHSLWFVYYPTCATYYILLCAVVIGCIIIPEPVLVVNAAANRRSKLYLCPFFAAGVFTVMLITYHILEPVIMLTAVVVTVMLIIFLIWFICSIISSL